MNKTKLLTTLVVALVVLNIVILLFMFLGRGKGHHRPPHDNMNQEGPHGVFDHSILGYDDQQLVSFEKSRTLHHSQIDSLLQLLDTKSNDYYKSILDQTTHDRTILISEIDSINHQIYRVNLEHFESLKSICRPDQLGNLEIFISHLLKQNDNGRKPKKPRRH